MKPIDEMELALKELQNAVKALQIANQCAERACKRLKPKLTVVK